MRDEVVAIDLESTGLDPFENDIIEVGAVKFLNGEIIDEFSTMVNPGTPIPQITTQITGIQQDDVINAPHIDTVLPQISKFVGKAPIIAHNVSLDMGFLQQRHKILKDNFSIDTYDLATILLPNAPRYNLNSLTQQVGIELENAHRALDDARAAGLLYWVLWQKVLNLPHHILKEISALARDLDWGTGRVFSLALRESTTSSKEQLTINDIFQPEEQATQKLHPNDSTTRIEVNKVADILGENGIFQQKLDNYEFRAGQLRMSEAIAETFNNQRHLIVEADTGTGKSFAYLIPSVLFSKENGERVVISTNTINLQDQLINNDIPQLTKILDIPVESAVLKGRSNYLCPRRLSTVRNRPANNVDELRTVAKILVWLLDNNSGDKNQVSLRGPMEHTLWQRLSAQDEGCTLHRCETQMSGACPFYKARKRAEGANIVVVNHALLISDAKSEHKVIPEYRYTVIDEAHNLEDAITHSQSFRIDLPTLSRRLVDLGTPTRGLFGEILRNMRNHAPEQDSQRVEQFIQTVSDAIRLMQTHIKSFFESVNRFLKDTQNKASSNDYSTLMRIDHSHRGRTGFAHVQSQWNTLDEFFDVIAKSMKRLNKAFHRLEQYNIPNQENILSATNAIAQYLSEIREGLHQFAVEPDSNMIYWLTTFQTDSTPSIHIAPLHVGPLMEQYLWHEKQTVILTSATLRTQDSFSYIKDRLYADAIPTLEVSSPFDYEKSTLLYLPSDIPEPNNRQAYQRAVERGIIELAAKLEGRVLALFTSYAQLRQTAQAITPRLALGNITVFDQSDGSSREALLEGFKSTEKAVLLGNKSFWEGVDIPGDSLSALVIVRLPFAVPSDPIFATRSDSYSNSFNDYAIPDAILRFRQGFGRLIRHKSDRGIVTVFDSRIQTKGYGPLFIEALPSCTVQTGLLDDLPEVAKNWLNLSSD